MPSRALVHFPEPATPTIVELTLSARPARGDEFPAGWTVCEYNLVGDVYEGEQHDFAVWVMPRSDRDSHLGDCGAPEQP
jgi:hypothetical protein